MAKKCTICKRSYPDQLPACPYCEPARPPSADDLLIDDIEIIADEAPRSPAARAPKSPPARRPAAAAPLGMLPEEEPFELIEEAPPPPPQPVKAHEETGGAPAGDVLEVVDEAALGSPAEARPDEPGEVVEPPSHVVVVDEAEVVEEPSAAPDVRAVVDEAKQAPPPPPVAPPRKRPPGMREIPATQLAKRSPTPTMLAPEEDLADMAGKGSPAAPAASAGPPAAPPAAAPPVASPPAPPLAAPPPPQKRGAPPKRGVPQKRGAQATRIASRAPAPTMLAPSDVPAELPNMELDSGKLPPAVAAPPSGKEASPAGMELDSGKIPAPAAAEEVFADVGDDVFDVVEASDVRTEPPAEVVEEMDEVGEVVEDDLGGATIEFQPEETAPPRKRKGKGRVSEIDALDLLADDVLLESASEVDMAGQAGGKGERPSGVDLVAEALESGVDLAHEPPKARAPAARKKPAVEQEAEIDLEGMAEEGPESSAVDLGGPEPLTKGRRKKALSEVDLEEVAEIDEEFAEADEELVEAAEEVAEVDEDFVETAEEVTEEAEAVEEVLDEDLVVPKTRARGKGKSRVAQVEEDAEEAVAIEEEVEEDLVVPKTRGKTRSRAAAEVEVEVDAEPAARRRKRRDDDDEEPRRGRRERAGGGFLRFVGTLLFGILLAAGAAVGVWYVEPDLLTEIPESPKKLGFKWQESGAKAQKELAEVKKAKTLEIGELQTALAAKEDENNKYRDEKAKLGGNLEKLQADLKTQSARLALVDAALKEAKMGEGKPLPVADYETFMSRLVRSRAAVTKLFDQLGVLKEDELLKTVGGLEEARKVVGKKLAAVNAKLEEAGADGKDAEGVQKLAEDRDAWKAKKKAVDDQLKVAEGAVDKALEELRLGNLAPAKTDPKDRLATLTKAVHAARLKAESPLASSLGQMFSSLGDLGGGAGKLLQRGLDSTADKAELAAAKIRQALSETPEQHLDTNIALLRGGARKDASDIASARKYLEWTNSKEARVGPETRAKALFVLALAQRNNGQFADATGTLGKALKAAAALKAPPAWAVSAKQTLGELTDSTVYYLPRAQRLQAAGKLESALAELNTGLDAIPNDPRLHALRGLVRLELAQGAGKLNAATQAQIRKDAAAAREDPRQEAEAYYVLGRLEERLGEFSKADKDGRNKHMEEAENNYRMALKTHKGTPEEANRYRIALARLLVREPPPPIETPPAKGKGADVGRLAPPRPRPGESTTSLDPRLTALVLLTTTLQVPPLDEDDEEVALAKRLKEVYELAEKLIESPNKKTQGEGYMIRGVAKTRQGKRGEGIRDYARGLKLYYPGKETAELARLVNEHPALQRPDAVRRYNPLLAERHFGRGLSYFWQRRYRDAEGQFAKAVANYDQDARYWYFLGLARHQQQTKAMIKLARDAFTEGAQHEAASRPSTGEVNASLERLQGSLRQVLDRYRLKSSGAE